MKDFFKLTKKKVVLTIALTIVFFLVIQPLFLFPTYDGPNRLGFPLTFNEAGCWRVPPDSFDAQCMNNFFFWQFVIDLIFWLIISYLVVSLFTRKK